jgi:hypothetical protein
MPPMCCRCSKATHLKKAFGATAGSLPIAALTLSLIRCLTSFYKKNKPVTSFLIGSLYIVRRVPPQLC